MNEKGEKHLAINISFGTLFKIASFLLCVYLIVELRSLILLILSAAVISSIIEPGIRWLSRRRIQRVFSAIIMYLAIAAVITFVFSFVLPPLFTEAVSAINGLPKHIQTMDVLRPLKGTALQNIQTVFPDLPQTISIGDAAGMFTGAISELSGGFFDTISGFFGGLFSLVLVIVLSFYLSVRDDGIGEFLSIVTPQKHERYIRDLWRRSQNKIGKWMQGQLILAVAVFVMVYIALLAIGIDHPFLLAVLAGIFELIPIIGMTLAAVPAFLFATIDGGIGLGLIVIAVYVFIQQIEAHIIYPLITKKMVGVPPLLVIVSLIAGAELAGFIGVLLSIPISVALVEFLEDNERRKKFAAAAEKARTIEAEIDVEDSNKSAI